MRCPFCDSKRTTSFMYGLHQPKRTIYCKRCGRLARVQVEEVEPLICSKCGNPIIADAGKYTLYGNNKVRHRRCPRRPKEGLKTKDASAGSSQTLPQQG
jgi:ribosomal protein L37E